ncbi:MAG: hypothetical protein ISS50_00455 [Anaerolineae bacterium]|nr:hypothetical protein [Anaerolineae bacterium]
MGSHFGLIFTTWLPLAALVLSLAACTPSYQVTWDQVQDQADATCTDARGEVLIVGGCVKGPSADGGQAQWTLTTKAGQVHKLSLTIYTNGQKWRGKGIHSTLQGGTVDIYINDVLVHTIVCDTLGEYGDYWPKKAPVGRPSYATGTIDVSGRGISGPTLTIKIVTSPHAAVDINRIEMSVASSGR